MGRTRVVLFGVGLFGRFVWVGYGWFFDVVCLGDQPFEGSRLHFEPKSSVGGSKIEPAHGPWKAILPCILVPKVPPQVSAPRFRPEKSARFDVGGEGFLVLRLMCFL